MSRRRQKDAENLISYFSNYSLTSFPINVDQHSDCNKLHKKLYSFMIFVTEYKTSQIQKPSLPIITYFEEALSDALLSIFLWAQGANKSAKLELRCIIENFIKALLSIADQNIVNEKRVFFIFEIAKTDIHFISPIGSDLLQKLKDQYGILCETVHSTPLGIIPLNALNLLPKYDISLSSKFSEQYIFIMNCILATIYLNYSSFIHKIHPENKQDFLDALSPSEIKRINEYLF
jgi:hypothetical protein